MPATNITLMPVDKVESEAQKLAKAQESAKAQKLAKAREMEARREALLIQSADDCDLTIENMINLNFTTEQIHKTMLAKIARVQHALYKEHAECQAASTQVVKLVAMLPKTITFSFGASLQKSIANGMENFGSALAYVSATTNTNH